MRLRDFLAIPFLVEAETVDAGDGGWLRRACCPELPDCAAEAPTIEEALARLDRRRTEVIVNLLRAGVAPPAPRAPLRGFDAEGFVAHLGMTGLATLLDTTPEQARIKADALPRR